MRLSKLEVLTHEEVRLVHGASLRVLERCGVKVMSDAVLALLAGHGVQVDRETRICKFPPKLVEDCIASAPMQFDLYGRNGQKAMTVGGGTPWCASGHNAVFCINPETLERRYATVRDVEEFGIVSQWCENIEIVGVPLNPMDVPARSTLLHAAKALLETTTKPLFLSTESCGIVESLLEMLRAAAGQADIGERPNGILQLSPSSPLFWEASAAEGVAACARAGVPLVILPEPMSGVSAPYSVAGLLTEHNAELLSGLVIAQLARPGTPVIYGSSWTTYDMRASSARIGSPESTLLRIAGRQMAGFYQLPSHTTATNTDSNAHDEHHAWESVLSNLAAMDAGNDIVMNSGMFAGGLTTSLEQLILDNEVNGIIRRLMRGIRVDADTVAAEVIEQVGPAGNFLMEDHTLDGLYGDEFYEPTLRLNLQYDSWMADGAPTVDRVAGRKAEEILTRGNPVAPAPALVRRLDEIIRAFEARTDRE